MSFFFSKAHKTSLRFQTKKTGITGAIVEVMLSKLDAAFSFHQSALKLRSQRQQILAANIANADTPKYKARDIDFTSEMQKVVANQDGMPQTKTNSTANQDPLKLSGALLKTSKHHLSGMPANNVNQFSTDSGEAMYRPIQQGSVDGNTVDMDVERNQFADNAVRYEASILMLNGAMKKMITAIRGE